MENKIPKIKISRALQHYDGRKNLAAFLGISEEAIMNWQRKNMIYLPDTRSLQVAMDCPDLIREAA